MASSDLIECFGTITDVHPGGTFTVTLATGQKVTAHLSGKIRRFQIRIVAGDQVSVEVSPYDLTKGRITYRQK